MVRKKVTPKFNTYRIVSEAILAGIGWGWARAHKYTDTPNEETVTAKIHDEIMLALDEVIDWGDE